MPASERDIKVIDALNVLVSRHGRCGFWKCFTRLRLDGRCWNKKRMHRVYCEMGLNLPRRRKRRMPGRPRQPLDQAVEPNRGCAPDSSRTIALYGGRRACSSLLVLQGLGRLFATTHRTSNKPCKRPRSRRKRPLPMLKQRDRPLDLLLLEWAHTHVRMLLHDRTRMAGNQR